MPPRRPRKPSSGPPAKRYITLRGYTTISQEIRHLRTSERPAVVQEVADAAAQGDRSENAEYIYGKKRLREIDRRLRYLSKLLEQAEVVDPRQQSGDRVFFGATVTVEDAEDQTHTYQIVGVDEADPAQGRVSWRSPLGAALMSRTLDDEVVVQTPGGTRKLYIAEVEYI